MWIQRAVIIFNSCSNGICQHTFIFLLKVNSTQDIIFLIKMVFLLNVIFNYFFQQNIPHFPCRLVVIFLQVFNVTSIARHFAIISPPDIRGCFMLLIPLFMIATWFSPHVTPVHWPPPVTSLPRSENRFICIAFNTP